MSNVLAAMAFLTRFLSLLEQGLVVFDARNSKTPTFMRKHALFSDDVLEILKELKANEIFRGPTPDHNGSPGEVMEFIHQWMNLKLYIKLKVVTKADGNRGAVLSIHEDEEGHYG